MTKGETKVPIVPDGGYGWIVCIAALLSNCIISGFALSAGVLLVELLKNFNEPVSTISLILSLRTGLNLCVGPFVTILLKRFTHRKIIIVGGLIGFISHFSSTYVNRVDVLILTYGVLGGISLGMCFFAANVIVGHYFDKKRATAVGMAVCGVGLGMFIFNNVTEMLLQHYGLKGTLLLSSGIVLNLVPLGALVRPMKYKTVSECEELQVIELDKSSKKEGTESNDGKSSSKNIMTKCLSSMNLDLLTNTNMLLFCMIVLIWARTVIPIRLTMVADLFSSKYITSGFSLILFFNGIGYTIFPPIFAKTRPSSYFHGKHNKFFGNRDMEDEIGKSGSKFIQLMKEMRLRQNETETSTTEQSNAEVMLLATCSFTTPITCDPDSLYRTADGSCNNLENPYWGKGVTPFNRFQTPEYFDGLDCCTAEDVEQCMPILLPNDDPYFGAFNRDCLPFTRALATPPLNCQPGAKEVLNSQTSFIDCSQVYGSTREQSLSLRTMANGLLLTTSAEDLDLLPVNNSSFCRVPDNFCFITGDARANQNNMLLTLHTIFLREHNRIARFLGVVNPSLDDEELFQESRRINIAQMQNIVYREYLPRILGVSAMRSHGLQLRNSGFEEYNLNINPAINVAFSGAAFRFGHSTIRSSFSNGIGQQILLSPSFNTNDPFYVIDNAVGNFIRGLLVDQAQTTDRLLTDQVTDRLFESAPGQSLDLASMNIQRGRDVGLRPYIYWRQWCGLSFPRSFADLVDHTEEQQIRLQRVYSDVADIDLWTGGLSERHMNGSNLGPTFACIIGRQFLLLKSGDRFWYENSGPQKFTSNQLAAIRQSSQSRILCDNSNVVTIQADPFTKVSETNPVVSCDSLPEVDLCLFARSMAEWSEWSTCEIGIRRRERVCLGPTDGLCSCEKNSTETDIERCV
ncbi:peroxidase-like [Octopus vulgaris]|uniref:Peroxidase-like n=1 Tax=Octopus vulgaris TaxID=6645 RepID=A0AA36BNX7_OCTVU|nr:peroxidase-like [Octopus vulgaris]